MISEKELKRIMASEGINCFNITSSNDYMMHLEENNLNEFLRFIKANNIKNVFYEFNRYDEEDFLIDEDEFDQDIYLLIEGDIIRHNEQIEKIDFSKPNEITIFCIYEGNFICITEENYWCKELDASKKVMNLLNDNNDKINNIKNKQKLNLDILIEELKNLILNDDEFKKCSNQSFRRKYMSSIFEREENEKYKQLFLERNVLMKYGTSINFIDMIWKENKPTLLK